MDETQIIFQVRMRLPGDEKSGNAHITGEQMTKTIDKAYARGKYTGWCSAMGAVRAAAKAAGVGIPEDVLLEAATKAPRVV